MSLQDEHTGTPNQPKKQGKRPKQKALPTDAPSPEPPNTTIGQPHQEITPEPPLPPTPPLPISTEHQKQPARPPAPIPSTIHRQPNSRPPREPITETQHQGGRAEQQPWVMRQHERDQGSAPEPQGTGFDPQLEPMPSEVWAQMSKQQRKDWRKRHHRKFL